MNQNLTEKEVLYYIDSYLCIMDTNFRKRQQDISYEELLEMIGELNSLFNVYFEYNQIKASRLCIQKYIPILNLMCKLDIKSKVEYEKYLKNAYRIAARTNLEDYFIYREWEEDAKDKFFAPRYEILRGYIHYLEEITLNPNFQLLIANLPSGYGKLLANETPVLTKKGWKQHGDLKVGDYVLSPSGNFVRVNFVHPKRFANCRVEFEDGEVIYCHNQHEWEMYDRYCQKERHLETNDMLGKIKTKDGRNRFLINHNFIVKGENKNLPVEPYTYGIWLGDGSTSKGVITENEEDKIIFDYIPYKITSIYSMKNNKAKGYYLTGLESDLHKIGLCYQKKKVEKYIDSQYLTASVEQRLELLAGIIDSDGYLDKIKQRYVISTTNEKIKDGVITLINSFGWRVSITKIEPKISTSGIKGTKIVYNISFSPTFSVPCKLERKKLTRFHKQRHIGIKSIDFCDLKVGNCITVEGGLYLVGKTLKMTHNTYTEKISEAWNFGYDPTGTVLSLCSNEDVVNGGSNTVRNEMKSPIFGEVFPNLKWEEGNKKYFLKETDSNWKLKDCKLVSSYYARTTKSNVVGVRASQRVHIDDLYPNHKEALNMKLNYDYFNDYKLVWRKRFIQNVIPKVVVTGTLWASGDFIALVIAQAKKEHKFKKHPKYKYTWISEDGTVAIVQVPALDYVTNKSTCPEIKSTKELYRERATIEPYLWETNFQQRPTDPESLFFSYRRIRTYEKLPPTDYEGTYAVIDATRKSGKDFFAMPIFKKVPTSEDFDYYNIDTLFTKTATKDLYEDICNKIIEHHIIELVIESNVTSELKQNLEIILGQNGIYYCQIKEKYNCENKAARIEDQKGVILKKLVFMSQAVVPPQSDLGKAMENLTLYNGEGRNENDDYPDACALFTKEIIMGGSKPQKVKPIFRPF